MHVCVSVYVCVRPCVFMFMRECVCVFVRSCVAAWYSWNVFHVYIMTIIIRKVLALVDQLCWKIVPVSMERLP